MKILLIQLCEDMHLDSISISFEGEGNMKLNIRQILDLSQSITPSDFQNPAFPPSNIQICMTYENEGWMGEIISAATHLGTHVDSPAHRIESGKTIEDFPLQRFWGEAVPIDLFYKNPEEEITLMDFQRYMDKIKEGDNILLCTGWSDKKNMGSKEEYIFNSPWLGRQACLMLIDKKVNAVGIDHFSIGGAKPENVNIAHDLLLNAEVLVFEDLKLPRELLKKERWYFAAFPMLAGSMSGSFIRAVAIDFENDIL